MGKCPFNFGGGEPPPGHPAAPAKPAGHALREGFNDIVSGAKGAAASPGAGGGNVGNVASCPFSFGLFPSSGRDDLEDPRDAKRTASQEPPKEFDITKLKFKKNAKPIRCGAPPAPRVPLEAAVALTWDESAGTCHVSILPAETLRTMAGRVRDAPEAAAKEISAIVSRYGDAGAVAAGDAGAVEELAEALFVDNLPTSVYLACMDALLALYPPMENRWLFMEHKVNSALEVLLDEDEPHAVRTAAAAALVRTGGSSAIMAGGGVPLVVQLARKEGSARTAAIRCFGALTARGAGADLVGLGADKILMAILEDAGADMELKEPAARAMGGLLHGLKAPELERLVALGVVGVVAPLLALKDPSADGIRESAARSLAKIASVGPAAAREVAGGSLARLSEQLRDGSFPAREAAARAVRALCQGGCAAEVAAEDGCMHGIVELARYGGHDGRVAAAEALRIMATTIEGGGERLLEANALPPLVSMMKSCKQGEVDLPLEGARAVTAVASAPGGAAAVVEGGAMAGVMELVAAGFVESREVALALARALEAAGEEGLLPGGIKALDHVMGKALDTIRDPRSDRWRIRGAGVVLLDLSSGGGDAAAMADRVVSLGGIPILCKRAGEGIRVPDPLDPSGGYGDDDDDSDESCAAVLCHLALRRVHKAALIEAAAPRSLLRLLRHGEYKGKILAAKGLCALGYSNAVASTSKGVPILLDLASPLSEDAEGQFLALQALTRVSNKDDEGSLRILGAKGADVLVAALAAPGVLPRERAAAGSVLQNLLDGSYQEDAIQAVSKAAGGGGIKELVLVCADAAAPAAARAAAGAALSYISGRSEHRAAVEAAGGYEASISLLLSCPGDGEEVAAANLSFLCSEGEGESKVGEVAAGGRRLAADAKAVGALQRVRRGGSAAGRRAARDALHAAGLERPGLLGRALALLAAALRLGGLLDPLCAPIEGAFERAAGLARLLFAGAAKMKVA